MFEGRQGFYQAFAGGCDETGLRELLESLGKVWEVEQLTFKPYPCGSIAHPYMDCALRLRERHRPAPGQIVEVRCRTAEGPVPRLWEPLAVKRQPQNGYAAKFSLPYLVAVILTKGQEGLAEFTDEAVQDRTVLEVASRVSYELDATIRYPEQFVGHIMLRLDDGRVLEESQDHPRGGPDFPMTREELEAKFRGSAGLLLPSEKIGRIIGEVGGLAARPEIASLVSGLTK